MSTTEQTQKESEPTYPEFTIKGMDKRAWLNVFKAIGALTEEVTLTVCPEGLTVRCMDPSHVALIDLNLPNTVFEQWEVNEECKFGVRVDEIAKVVSRMPKDATLKLTIHGDGMLNLSWDNRSYKYRVIEVTAGSTPLPKISFNAAFTIDTGELQKALQDLQVVSDYVSMTSSNEQVLFQARGDAGECNVRYDRAEQGIESISIREESKATYSLEYLVSMLKAVDLEQVCIEYSSKMPCRLSFAIGNVGSLGFFIAPRVEA